MLDEPWRPGPDAATSALVFDGQGDQDNIGVLESGQCLVNLGREHLGRRSIAIRLGAIQADQLDVGVIVFSEDADYVFSTTHGDIPK